MDKLDLLEQQNKLTTSRRGLTPGSIMLLAGLFVFIGVIALQFAQRQQGRPMSGPAPDFTLTTYEGQQFRLSEHQGDVVVINFWGSWCGPCRAEAPDLQLIWEDYHARGLVMIGVNWLDTEINARSFIAEFNLTYPNGLDVASRVANTYRIDAAPETFIVGRDGSIREVIWGPINPQRLRLTLERLLDEDV